MSEHACLAGFLVDSLLNDMGGRTQHSTVEKSTCRAELKGHTSKVQGPNQKMLYWPYGAAGYPRHFFPTDYPI